MEQLSTAAAETLQQWLEDASIDEATKQELRDLQDQPKELEERFTETWSLVQVDCAGSLVREVTG